MIARMLIVLSVGLGLAVALSWGQDSAGAQQALLEAALQIDKGRVFFSGAALGVPMGEVDLRSDHVYDYTFSAAPTDWIARSGEWNATNRWTCSPQWSWYGGYSLEGVAALWNKREFVGDITVELYCAFKMRLNRNPTYLHPNDVNITICGDGANLDSGYAFIIGGEDNRWTRIMRGTRVLAETRDPKALWPIYENGQPSTYEWHRKWWALRVRKSGSTLQIYFDENLVLEATDPQPLPGGRVALWVLRNDLITPRVKIYYEKEKLPRSPLPPSPSPLLAQTKINEPGIVLTSATHPSIQNDFENGLGRVVSRDEDQGAICSLVPDDPSGKGHCLQIANRAAGGHFGVNFVSEEFKASQFPILAFDYRITPEAKVNFYLTTHNGQRYEIIFNGCKEPAPGCIRLGAIEPVIADGQWHHAEFDLLGALQRLLGPNLSTSRVSDLWAGNLNNEGYLLAGFGGNRTGTTWHLDNFYLGKPQGRKLELAIAPQQGQEAMGYAVAVDDKPDGTPALEVNCKEGKYSWETEKEGRYYAHVRPLWKNGQWGPVVHYAWAVDHTPPAVKLQNPPPEVSLSDQPIVLKIQDPGGSGPDLQTLRLALGQTELSLASRAVDYDPSTQELRIDPRGAGLSLEDGGRVALAVQALSDRAGNALPAPLQWTLSLQHSSDRTPPARPVVQIGEGYICDDDFERDMGQWAPFGAGGAMLTRDDSTANSGKYSLKLYNPVTSGRFGVYILQKPFDAGKHRIVSFAYKCDDRLRADFAVYVNGDWKQIRFMDNDGELGVIGAVPNVQPDNRWHTTSFNLYEMLRRDDPQAPTFIVRQFVIADWGWAGNRAGATYHIDDFQIIPIVSGAQPLRLAWQAADVSGIAGAAYTVGPWDAAPPETINAVSPETPLALDGLTEGWLQVRVRDRAGNWSEVARRRLLVDSEPPTAQALAPVAGQRAAVSEAEIQLTDKGLAGINPSSIRLKVNDTEYVMDGAALRFNPVTGRLIWNCEEVRPQPVVFPDQSEVRVQLLAAADYAGNPVSQLPAWSWIMDYALDKTPPIVREIHSTTHPTWLTQNFEDDSVPWQTHEGANGAKVEIVHEGVASGKGAIRLTNQRQGGHMGAVITREPYDAEKYPIIAFDYRIPPETKLALTVMIRGRAFAITLNDAPTDVLGRFPNIVADGKWRHTSVDLLPLLRRQFSEGPLVVELLLIGDRNTMDNAPGAWAEFDNFIIGQIGKYAPVLRWRATDTTGIKNFSFVLDQNAATVPDETPEGAEVAKSFEDCPAGIYFFHIRAQDGAGNWGPPLTYALLHQKAD